MACKQPLPRLLIGFVLQLQLLALSSVCPFLLTFALPWWPLNGSVTTVPGRQPAALLLSLLGLPPSLTFWDLRWCFVEKPALDTESSQEIARETPFTGSKAVELEEAAPGAHSLSLRGAGQFIQLKGVCISHSCLVWTNHNLAF